MIIENYQAFVGHHCETTTTGNLLHAAGLELSEPMLFGLGEGLAFGVFVFKAMNGPFIGGRPRLEHITQALGANLGFEIEYRTTRSTKRAWDNIAQFIDAGQPVGVKLNSRLLDYFTSDVDFAGHYVAVYGYDDNSMVVVDTAQQGGAQVTDRHRFEEGRLWKGPMASNAMTWTVSPPTTKIDWPSALRNAITTNTHAYLNPPIKNFGAKGIRKTAGLISGWYEAYDSRDLAHVGELMERGGTGGGLFRPMYAEFLREAHGYLDDDRLLDVAARFDSAASLWTSIADCLEACEHSGPDRLSGAGDLLIEVAEIEEAAVRDLAIVAAS